MNILESLAGGLRGAAGVLSPTVQKQTFQQDQRQQELQQQEMIRRRNLAAQQIIKAAEMGAVEPEAAKIQLQRLGFGDVPVGPSAETQARQTATAKDKAFREELSTAGGNMEEMAKIATKYGKPELAVSMFNAQETRAAREAQQRETLRQRQQELEAKIQQARDSRASREEIAKMQIEARREIAQLAASLRQPPQQQVVQTETGPMVLGPGGQAKPVIGPDGQPVRGVKSTGNDKPLTEFQGRNYLFGTRSAEAHNVLNELEEKISTSGLAVKQSLSGPSFLGGILGAAGNAALSKEQQKVEQAQRNFVNAVLRQESGAVISDAEFANAQKQYFPQPGDSKQVIEQKRKNRETAISGFQKLSGPGGADIAAIRELGKKPKQDILDQADAIINGGK